MKLLDSLRFRIATLFRRSQMNAEMDEELRSHIQHRANDLTVSCPLSRRLLPAIGQPQSSALSAKTLTPANAVGYNDRNR